MYLSLEKAQQKLRTKKNNKMKIRNDVTKECEYEL